MPLENLSLAQVLQRSPGHFMPDDFEWSFDWLVMKAGTDFPPDNVEHYLQVMAIYCLYFTVLNLITHGIFLCCNETYSKKLEPIKRTEYRANVLSIFHASIAVILSSLGMWWVCDEDKDVFNDKECMNTPKYIHLWALMHSVGYFIIDTFNLFFLIKEWRSYDI